MDVIVDQPNILPAERRKRFAEFQRSGYYCQAMVVVPEESVRQDRATKRVASTGKVEFTSFFYIRLVKIKIENAWAGSDKLSLRKSKISFRSFENDRDFFQR